MTEARNMRRGLGVTTGADVCSALPPDSCSEWATTASSTCPSRLFNTQHADGCSSQHAVHGRGPAAD